MNRVLPFVLAAAVTTAAALAQGTIQDAQVRYTVGPIALDQADSVNSGFTGNPVADSEVMFEHWWYYRIDNDPQEFALRADPSLSQSYSGSHADLDWTDIDQRGLIAGSLDIDVASTGATMGIAVFRFRVTNISAAPISLSLFNYVDLDLCIAGSNAVAGTGERQVITQAVCATETLEFFGADIDAWEVGAWTPDEFGLTDRAVTNLASTGLPFNGDYTSAVQWNRSLAPGESASFVSAIGDNDSACPATTRQYGQAYAGTPGLPAIVSGQPVIGTTVSVGASNALAGSNAALLISPLPANVPVLGMTALVDLGTSFGLNAPVDAQGAASVPVTIPPASALCGVFVYYQWFILDPGAANGLTAHTRGLHWRVGQY